MSTIRIENPSPGLDKILKYLESKYGTSNVIETLSAIDHATRVRTFPRVGNELMYGVWNAATQIIQHGTECSGNQIAFLTQNNRGAIVQEFLNETGYLNKVNPLDQDYGKIAAHLVVSELQRCPGDGVEGAIRSVRGTFERIADRLPTALSWIRSSE